MNVKDVLCEMVERLQPLVSLINESTEPDRYEHALSIQRLLMEVAGIEDDHDYGLYEIPEPGRTDEELQRILDAHTVELPPGEFKVGLHPTTPTTVGAELEKPFADVAAAELEAVKVPYGICIGSGMRTINAERSLQIYGKGFDAARDDCYQDQELLKGAIYYACAAIAYPAPPNAPWPFNKPPGDCTPRKAMAAAGALLAAEFDRINRLESFDDDIPF